MESIQDNNLDDQNLEEMKALVIDALSPPSISFDDENSETFFTLLGLEEKV